MASKKYKPALFELINKGPLKPDAKGSLVAPRWFYKISRRRPFSSPTLGKPETPLDVVYQVKQDAHEDQRAACEAPVLPTAMPPQAIRPANAEAAGGGEKPQPLILGRFSPSWLMKAGLLVLGLIFVILLIYRLVGWNSPAAESPRTSSQASSEPAAPAAVPPAIETRQGPVSGTPAVRSAEPAPVIPQVQLGQRLPSTPAASEPAIPAPRTGQAWVICSIDKRETLVPVQQYFSQNGVATDIGNFGGSFVLYTVTTFGSRTEDAAVTLKKRIVQLGRDYNSQKPKDAPIFNPSTFEQAYAVNVERIKPIP